MMKNVPEIRFKADDGNDFPDWEEKKLGDFLEAYSDRDNSALHPVVAVGHWGIRKREDIYSKALSKDISKNRVIDKNTMVIGMGGVNKQIDMGWLLEDVIYSVSPNYSTYHIQNVYPLFLEIFMQYSNNVLSVLYMSVSVRKSVNKEGLLSHSVLISSSLEEQRKIATYFSQLDNLIAIHQKKRELFKILRKALVYINAC